MIGIIDYGMGNLGSVSNAFDFLEIESRIITRSDELGDCRAVILPGVGAFGDCMEHLSKHGFVESVKAWIAGGRPFLGICLGLQVLYEGSDESPGTKGLGLFKGWARRFPEGGLKVPQIGWNCVEQVNKDCPLFGGLDDQTYFYFVHSYYVDPEGDAADSGRTEYGISYTSAIWSGNVMAVQFHPEKSQARGLSMLRNFVEWSERYERDDCDTGDRPQGRSVRTASPGPI